jgi:hypothetical protein
MLKHPASSRREQSERVKIRPHPDEFPIYFDG